MRELVTDGDLKVIVTGDVTTLQLSGLVDDNVSTTEPAAMSAADGL